AAMVQASYGLGWMIHEHRGHRVVSHGGAGNGGRVQIVLVPAAKLGFAILSNVEGIPQVTEALREALLDYLLDLPKKDWNAYYPAIQDQQENQRKGKEAKRSADRRRGTKPTLELATYAGTYRDSAFGEATVTTD